MDPKERTERMLKEERERVIRHENARQENGGRSNVPLSAKLRIALPLAGVAIGLYCLSFYATSSRRKKSQQVKNKTDGSGSTEPITAGDLQDLVPEPEPLSMISPESYSSTEFTTDFNPNDDGEFLKEDLNKRW